MVLRMGMIGGGSRLSIGQTHRLAAQATGEIELVAGVFSSDPERSRIAGAAYGVEPARAYTDLPTMLAAERARSDGVDFVSIVTPNYLHYPAASAALEAGFAVMGDKPMTARLEEARQLRSTIRQSGRPYALSYTYSAYPAVREARARIAAGRLGDIRKIVVEYAQGWLANPSAGELAAWRIDPARAGVGGCIADIGVHAFHLAEFVSGLRVSRIMADLGAVVPGRALDDDCAVLLRFENGARGAVLASQIEIGQGNGLRLRCDGEKASLVWQLDDPHCLTIHRIDGSTETVRLESSGAVVPAPFEVQHADGYMDAFATVYRDFAAVLRGEEAPLLPGADDGLRGMAFIETAVEASRANAGWVDFIV